MKKYIKTILIFTIALFLTSCSDEYFDVNTPSDATRGEDVSLAELMPTTALYVAKLPYLVEAGGVGYYSQHIANKNGGTGVDNADQHYVITEENAWKNIYLHAMIQSQVMIDKATDANAIHYAGIAKVMKAVSMGYLIDTWGDVPYSEALLGTSNPTPVFDSQEDVYNAMMALLNDAVADMAAADTSGQVPGGDDIFYNGDMSKWIKAAHTLMARNAIHLTKAGASAAAANALTHLNMGFASNADNLQVVYTSRVKNPWHTSVVLSENTSNNSTMVSDQLVDTMDGTSFPFNTVSLDPRLPIYVDNGGAATYKGVDNGDGVEAGDNAYFNGNYVTFDMPLPIITYAEAQFIRAEAEFLANGGNATSVGTNAAAYQAYQDGIAASMDAVGVSAAAKTAYMADTSVDVGMANLAMKHIMREKFVANWLNPETFNDERRYDFSPNVFVDLAQPTFVNPANGGAWVRRASYPSTESERNPVNTAAAAQPITTPVWWDM